MIPALIGATAVIVIASTTHLSRSGSIRAKKISSGLLFILTAAAVPAFGTHLCKEGGAPLFVVLSTAIAVATTPWFLAKRVWLLRGFVAILASCGMLAASYLAESYHRADITGNPKYSSGRLWHTPFTGQYPRDPSSRINHNNLGSLGRKGSEIIRSEQNSSAGAGQNEDFHIWKVTVLDNRGASSEYQLDVFDENAAEKLERIIQPLFESAPGSFLMSATAVSPVEKRLEGDKELSITSTSKNSIGPFTPNVNSKAERIYSLLNAEGKVSRFGKSLAIRGLCEGVIENCQRTADSTVEAKTSIKP